MHIAHQPYVGRIALCTRKKLLKSGEIRDFYGTSQFLLLFLQFCYHFTVFAIIFTVFAIIFTVFDIIFTVFAIILAVLLGN